MHLMALTFPIWGVATPVTMILFIVLLLKLPANLPLGYAAVLIVGMLIFSLACTVLAVYLDDDEIRVSKDGLRFPLKFYPSLKNIGQRAWKDLAAIKINWKRNTTFSEDETLTLVFNDGGYACMQIQCIEPAELEQFFIAFEACAYNCDRDADLADFERAIQCRKGDSLYSYTELWERSLSTRFCGATFTPLEPNTRLQNGRYQILNQLAFGGFSAVYLARDESGGFAVLKESSFPQTDDVQSKASELFKREAELLNKLDHPNIAKVHDYFIENGRHYLVVEHVKGIDLNRLVMESGAQNPDSVRNWMKQLCDVLIYLHEQSPPVVHRDLTPDNVILKPDGSIVLIDFGAAKEIVSGFTGTIIGKQAYMAPEQFRGKPVPKSDVFSLGATAAYLLTRKLPQPLEQTSIKAINPNGAEVPQGLCDLIYQCTALEDAQRPDAAQLLAALRAEEKVGALAI